MKILGINHLGIAAKDPTQAKKFFHEVLGLPHLGDEIVAEQKTNTMMIESVTPETTAGRPGRLEILEPTDNDSPISKYLEKRGGGIHHIALTVDSIEETIEHLLAHDVQMIDTKPRNGAHKTRIAFVHPRATGGVLVEFVEESKN